MTEARKQYLIEYRLKNKAKEQAYLEAHREQAKLRSKLWYENNKERRKQYKLNNKEKIKESRRKTTYKAYHSNPCIRLKITLRNRLNKVLKTKGFRKIQKTLDLFGCTVPELKMYLESKFKQGMNWENHGDWHIDHIVPLSSATTEKDMVKLCHYTNLQPLWAKENLQKHDKFNGTR